MQLLSSEQISFFRAFGYVVLPGLVANDIDWITSEFAAVFTDRGIEHDETQRSIVVPFIDQREKLSTLLDHPGVKGIAASLLGEDFNYINGDGNYYSGDTSWHRDGLHATGQYLKIAFYLDPVTRDTGALRVIPGSHVLEFDENGERQQSHWDKYQPTQAPTLWNIPQSAVPAVSLDSNPGDVVAFDHNIFHGAFGGSTKRRMFTLNLCRRAETPGEIKDLKDFIATSSRFWIDQAHGEIMRRTASQERMKHLKQVMENEEHLPALSALARQLQPEPARS